MTRSARTAFCLTAILILGAASCTRIGLGTPRASGTSVTTSTNDLEFSSDYRVRVFRALDENTADIYLTDLSDDELAAFFTENPDWSNITGTLLSVRMFIEPKPGNTPIDPTAVSAAVRSIIITQGQIGVYDGAGFLLPGGSIKSGRLAGSIRNAPLRLTRKTSGFRDPLVAPSIDVRFSVVLNEQAADELAARAAALSAAAQPAD